MVSSEVMVLSALLLLVWGSKVVLGELGGFWVWEGRIIR